MKGSQAVKKIAEAIGRELVWVQPTAWKMEYDLRAGDELIATLHFRSSFFIRIMCSVESRRVAAKLVMVIC